MSNNHAFTAGQLLHFRRNLLNMQQNHEEFEPAPFSQDEILALFVKGSDHQTVLEAGRLYGATLPYYTMIKHLSTQTPQAVTMQVSLLQGQKWGFPRYASMIADDAPRDLVNAFHDYCERRVAISRDYGLAHQTLEVLNEICSTPSQVAFLWPSIHALAEDKQLKEMLNKKPKSLPAVPPQLREACAKTATTITMNTMLGTPPKPNHAVHVSPSGHFVATGPMGNFKTHR